MLLFCLCVGGVALIMPTTLCDRDCWLHFMDKNPEARSLALGPVAEGCCSWHWFHVPLALGSLLPMVHCLFSALCLEGTLCLSDEAWDAHPLCDGKGDLHCSLCCRFSGMGLLTLGQGMGNRAGRKGLSFQLASWRRGPMDSWLRIALTRADNK